MKRIFLTISFIFLLCSSISARTLDTSICTIDLDLYNVAIVGNSHASYSSNFLGIDNDIHSHAVGNHSVGGDDLPSYGLNIPVTTDWKHGSQPIAEKGDCKNWIKSFLWEDINSTEHLICWFGSNTLNQNLEKFVADYKLWILQAKRKNIGCNIYIMAIPYTKFENKKLYQTDEYIDKWNNALRNMVKDCENYHVYFIDLPEDVEYIDKVHLTEKSYKRIWNDLIDKYDIEVKKLKDVDNTLHRKKQTGNLISHMGSWICMSDTNKYYQLPPNSIESFTETKNAQFYACEGDLNYNEGQLYMSHDKVDDISNKPTFLEYLQIFKNSTTRPLIDIKWDVNTRMMLKEIDSLNMKNQCIAQCSDPEKLGILKDSGIDICLLVGEEQLNNDLWYERALKYGVEMINISYDLINQEIIDKCHKSGIKVCVYSVDKKEQRDELLKQGVDYIMTNCNS